VTSRPLSAEEGRRLLDVAREAIVARMAGRGPSAAASTPRLSEPGGAFVTLRKRRGGELRGCVGYVEPVFPLIETVARAAVAAAFEDRRFACVTEAEWPSLSVEISAISPTRPLRPDEVEVGTDGLVIRHEGRSGLLLPQVPIEHGWDRCTFLEQLCRKAGLPKNAWRSPDVELLAFRAQVLGEG